MVMAQNQSAGDDTRRRDLSYDGLRGIEADAFAGLGQLTFL